MAYGRTLVNQSRTVAIENRKTIQCRSYVPADGHNAAHAFTVQDGGIQLAVPNGWNGGTAVPSTQKSNALGQTDNRGACVCVNARCHINSLICLRSTQGCLQ